MDSNHSSYSYTSINKSSAETDTLTTQESGWTAYFEDFMVAQQQDHHHNHSFIDHHQQQHDQLDLSDAASHVDWNNIANSMNGAAPKFPKKLNLIKKASKRTREIVYDDSLEDTASSPVNSPKVGSQQMVFEETNIGSTDLRKRGLCLVPLSMVVNYI